MFQDFVNIWIISGLTFFLHHGLRFTDIIYNSFQSDSTIWCKNSCWVGSALSSKFEFKFEKRNLNWGPRNLYKECAHPNKWRDKHTHTTCSDRWWVSVYEGSMSCRTLLHVLYYLTLLNFTGPTKWSEITTYMSNNVLNQIC